MKSKTDISQFLSYFDAGARANRFEVLILNDDYFNTKDGHYYRCVSANLPGIAMNTNTEDTGWSGSREIPDGTIDYGDTIALTFLCDSSFYDRFLIDMWLRDIYEGYPDVSADSREMGTMRKPVMRYIDEYTGEIMINQLRLGGSPALQYRFFDCYPVSYSEQALSNTDTEIMKFEATFSYKDFLVDYPPNKDEPRKVEPKNNGAGGSITKGRGLLDATLDTLKVASRFSPKAGEYLTKLSTVDTQLTRGRNINRNYGGLFGGDD
jgi:hypothetical protein